MSIHLARILALLWLIGCGDNQPGMRPDDGRLPDDAGVLDGGDDASVDAVPLAPSCTDGTMNGTETGIDCGGDCNETCPPADPPTLAPAGDPAVPAPLVLPGGFLGSPPRPRQRAR